MMYSFRPCVLFRVTNNVTRTPLLLRLSPYVRRFSNNKKSSVNPQVQNSVQQPPTTPLQEEEAEIPEGRRLFKRRTELIPGRVLAWFGNHMLVEDLALLTQHLCFPRKKLDPVPVCGDYVQFSKDYAESLGIVESSEPRVNVYRRARTVFLGARSAKTELKPLAANIDRLVIVAAPRPRMKTELIDGLVVMATSMNAEPVIVFNKNDLFTDDSNMIGLEDSDWYGEGIEPPADKLRIGKEERIQFERVMDTYRKLGYQVIKASVKNNIGVEQVRSIFTPKSTTLLAGQSGVGKSSLLNALFPHLHIDTRTLDKGSGQGRHTTTNLVMRRLYLDPNSPHNIDQSNQPPTSTQPIVPDENFTYIIDTPGVQALTVPAGYAGSTPALVENGSSDWVTHARRISNGFSDFVAQGSCKWPRCMHMDETHCKVVEGVQKGEIAEFRYNSYLALVNLAKEMFDAQYKPKSRRPRARPDLNRYDTDVRN